LTGELHDVEEAIVDGITVTLDALYEDCPWELKDTDQSSARPLEENMYQIRQVMAQCYIRSKLVGRLSRLENMGDWGWVFPKGSTPSEKKAYKEACEHPTLSAFKLTFTQAEVLRNWEWLCSRRDLFQGILDTGELLPKVVAVPSGQLFECGYCAYKGGECCL